MTTQSGCAWTAASPASWMSITAGSSGTGPGTVSYSVAANTATSSRTAASTIAGLTFTTTQTAAAQPPPSAGYTITAAAGTGGSISPHGSCSVTSGTSKSFSIAPNTNYAISNVTVDGKSVGAVASYTFSSVSANHTINASFTASAPPAPPPSTQTYTIYSYRNAGGSISPSGNISVKSGASQTYTIAARSGYTINTIVVDGVSVGPMSSYTFNNVKANHTIKASFIALQ